MPRDRSAACQQAAGALLKERGAKGPAHAVAHVGGGQVDGQRHARRVAGERFGVGALPGLTQPRGQAEEQRTGQGRLVAHVPMLRGRARAVKVAGVAQIHGWSKFSNSVAA
jgi:hypothetical protein